MGLDWEPHEVKTEDGWYLTVFRVISDKGDYKSQSKSDEPEKLPILMVPGSVDSAFGFMSRAPFGRAWTLQMVDLGYEVWFNNSRGIEYSDKRDGGDKMSRKEYWDYDWADMGLYDLPASIEGVLAVSGAPKLTIVAHSMGTSATWYGMAHKQDFFAERVHRFVALSSCVYPALYDNLNEYDEITSLFLRIEELGYTSMFGPEEDETSPFFTKVMCDADPTSANCNWPEWFPDFLLSIDQDSFRFYPISIKQLLYFAQLYLEQRFQEPQTLAKYAMGERITPLVPVWNIDRVPVTLVHGLADERCPIHQAEFMLDQIKSPERYFVVQNASHYTYLTSTDPNLVRDIDQIIKTGHTMGSGSLAITVSGLAIAIAISVF